MAKEDMGSVSENTELSEDIEQLSIPNVSHDMLKKIVDGTEESRCPSWDAEFFNVDQRTLP